MDKRKFRDAPDWARCVASVTLRDGTTARCGRYRCDEWSRNPCAQSAAFMCTQHGNMALAGKSVRRFATEPAERGQKEGQQ